MKNGQASHHHKKDPPSKWGGGIPSGKTLSSLKKIFVLLILQGETLLDNNEGLQKMEL